MDDHMNTSMGGEVGYSALSIHEIYSDLTMDPSNKMGRFHPAATLPDTNKSSTVNICGVIVSAGIPKRTTHRASHPFSISYSIIDPTLPQLHLSVCVNWFYHDLQTLPQVQIGDVVFFHNLFAGAYNGHPQYSGNVDKSTMMIFHPKVPYPIMDFHSLFDVIHFQGHLLSALNMSRIHHKDIQKPTLNMMLSREEWDLFVQGKHLLFHWEQVNGMVTWVVLTLASWAFDTFAKSSFSDDNTIIFSSLQGIIDGLKKSKQPEVNHNESLLLPPPPTDNRTGDLKFDTIVLVVENNSSVNNPNSQVTLRIWDGSLSGFFQSSDASEKERIRSALLQASADDNPLPEIYFNEDRLLGTTAMIQSADIVYSHLLKACPVGSWLRLRNVLPYYENNVLTLEIRPDTHIGVIQPYFYDVKLLVKRYEKQLNQRINESTKALPPNNNAQEVAVEPIVKPQQEEVNTLTKAKRTYNTVGHPFTPLTLVLSIPAPAQFCCFGKIVSWYPQQVADFLIPSLQSSSLITASKHSTDSVDGSSSVQAPPAAAVLGETQTEEEEDDAFLHRHMDNCNIFTQTEESDDNGSVGRRMVTRRMAKVLDSTPNQQDDCKTFTQIEESDDNGSVGKTIVTRRMAKVLESASSQQNNLPKQKSQHIADIKHEEENKSLPTHPQGSIKLMFSLRLTDGTAEVDIVFYDHDAEYFLGVNAVDFAEDVDLQEKIQKQLENLRNSQDEVEVYLKSYIPMKRKRVYSADYVIKRFRGFHCQLPSTK